MTAAAAAVEIEALAVSRAVIKADAALADEVLDVTRDALAGARRVALAHEERHDGRTSALSLCSRRGRLAAPTAIFTLAASIPLVGLALMQFHRRYCFQSRSQRRRLRFAEHLLKLLLRGQPAVARRI